MTIATPRAVSPTERKLAEMLVENTGAAMMDSGMYGRAWQQTRAKYGLDGGLPNSSFHGGPGHRPDEPTADEIERVALAMRDEPYHLFGPDTVAVNTFHFLNEALIYEPELDAKYQRWTRVTNFGKDRYDKDWGLPLMERFCEALIAKGYKVTGIYGDGTYLTENTYNHEDALDRTLQFTLFSVTNPYDGEYEVRTDFLPEDSYVLLQIHGGADVRGGYTDPVLFRQSASHSEYHILDFGRVSLRCEGNPDGVGQLDFGGREITIYDKQHSWESENGGYDFNLDGMWGTGQTVMGGHDADALDPIVDDDSQCWRCPIEGCGAVLS